VIVYVRNSSGQGFIVDCAERRDTILLYAAGVLDAGECGGLREHLAGGCPTCAGYLAEAEATLAMLPMGLDVKEPSAAVAATDSQ
jgi:hypothetical protein